MNGWNLCEWAFGEEKACAPHDLNSVAVNHFVFISLFEPHRLQFNNCEYFYMEWHRFDHMEVVFYFDHMEVVRGQFQREILMLPFSQLQNQPRGNVWKVISDRGEIKSHICDRGMFEKSYQIRSGGNTTILTLFQTPFGRKYENRRRSTTNNE